MSRDKEESVLIVEDDVSLANGLGHNLRFEGYHVRIAMDGETGLQMALDHHPDLIVLDIMMPRMDGREVRKRLAADPKTKGIPILFLSAVGDLSSQLDTLEEGRGEYMTKPFKPSELADYVDAMLDPKKSGELERHRSQHVGRLRRMVEIMHRPKGE